MSGALVTTRKATVPAAAPPAQCTADELCAPAGGIRHAAQLVVLFTADDEIATHDLDVWTAIGRERGLPIETRAVRRVRITDRLGNSLCSVALFPLRMLHP